jgi:gliding motility-associated-like protein
MTTSLKIRGVVIIMCMLAVADVFAQGLSRHNWYFGNSAQGIRFNRTTNVAELVTNQFTPFTTGGSAVASDQANGNLLFYTNGNTVIDRTHQIMTNGSGITGNALGNQPVAISPRPGNPNQYYVFSNSANFTTGGTIRVSIVDLALPGNAPFPTPAVGAVTTKNDAASINLSGRSEAMLTIPHSNGIDYWLITHQNGTDNYTSTLIDVNGFTPFPQNNVTGISLVAGNFSYHAASGKIAVTPQDANRNIVILNFNSTTGELLPDQFVTNSAETVAQSIYDTEWSRNGNFLYISKLNDVVQFDLANPTNSLASILPNSLTMVKSYGIQLAPDSAMYHLYEATAGVFRLGKLVGVDSLAGLGAYSATAFPGNINFNGRQFPSFAPGLPILPAVSFTFAPDPPCANTPVQFFPEVTPAADSLVWAFGDGTSSSQWSPVYRYASSGGYLVNVTPYLGGVAGTPFSQQVNVTTFNLQLSLVQDTTACSCSLVFPQSTTPLQAPPDAASCARFTVTATATGGTGSYQWYGPDGLIAGATSLTFQPERAGYYWVVATSGTCQTYAGVNVREYNVIDQRANMWYFGNNAGLDFNFSPPVAISNPVMNAPEGTATICDRNGNVLFFTDGESIWNRTFAIIGTGIGGDLASAQSSLIIPVPGDETLFYVFTTQDVGSGRYELRYSLYDIKLNNGAGGLKEFNKLLYTPSTERITSDGNWLIAHEYGNNSFRAYLISAAGIGNPVISSIGSDHTFSPPQNGEGYMKVNGGELAVALSTGSANYVEIFDFDNTTGNVSNFRSVNLTTAVGRVYGIEFAGDKIFASVRGAGSSQIFEILDTLGAAPNIVALPPITINAEIGALQRGPDGQIYVAVRGATQLGAITVNFDPEIASTYTAQGSPQLLGTSQLGLPNFAQSVGNGPAVPAYLITGFCQGSPTDFSATGTDAIDKYLWTVTQSGNLIFSTDLQAFSFIFTVAGTYTVKLQISNGCGYRAEFTEDILIGAPPVQPLPAAFCTTANVVLDANPNNVANYTYLWYNGATTETISVSQQGSYPVTITTLEGCVLDARVMAVDARTPINLGADQEVCSSAGVSTQLDGQINTNNHDWYLSTNGGAFVSLGNVTQLQGVTLTTAGTFAYLDIYTNPITTCISRDTVTFSINQSPVYTAIANPIACATNTGQIQLNITASATSLFTYILTPPTGPTTTVTSLTAGARLIPPVANLSAGTYSLDVIDQISGCNAVQLVPINTNAFTVGTVQADACPDSRIQINPSAANNYTYIIRDDALQIVDQGTFNAATFTTTVSFPIGNYNIELTFGGCTSSSTLSIAPTQPQATISFTPDVCNGDVTVNTNGIQYSWTSTPAGGIVVGTENSQTVSVNPGTWILNATVSGPGVCPNTNSITVTVDGPVTPDIDPSDPCFDEVTLTALVTPSGAYDYLWRQGATDIGVGPEVIVTQTNTYTLIVVNSLSGCSFTTNELVDVIGLKTVFLTTDLPCDDSFIITATPSEPVSSSYNWFKDGAQFATTDPNQVTASGSGLYRVTVTIIGCPATYEMPIVTLPSPEGILPNRKPICNDDANPDPDTKEVLLEAGTGFASYTWYQGGVEIVGATNDTYVATEPGVYSVEIVNNFGCTGEDETLIEEDCLARIEAPTAFRPGSGVTVLNRPDLSNSDFWVYGYFIDELSFQIFIYNRWGEIVYQSDDINFRWNGGYKNNEGQILPAGTYTYVVRYKSKYRGGVKEQRGGVVLMR